MVRLVVLPAPPAPIRSTPASHNYVEPIGNPATGREAFGHVVTIDPDAESVVYPFHKVIEIDMDPSLMQEGQVLRRRVGQVIHHPTVNQVALDPSLALGFRTAHLSHIMINTCIEQQLGDGTPALLFLSCISSTRPVASATRSMNILWFNKSRTPLR